MKHYLLGVLIGCGILFTGYKAITEKCDYESDDVEYNRGYNAGSHRKWINTAKMLESDFDKLADSCFYFISHGQYERAAGINRLMDYNLSIRHRIRNENEPTTNAARH